MITVYGIKTCGSVRNALKFFKDNNIEVEFFDFKKETPSSDKIKNWTTKADINEVMPLINDKVNEIVFYGQLGIYKKIEKEIKNNRPEVNILWQ